LDDAPLYDEKGLLRGVVKGDEKAFRELMLHYWDRMYTNILYHCKQPELAAELTQDLFVAIWQNRLKLNEIERFDSYLYTIAKNLVLGALRKNVLPIIDTPAFDPYFTDDGLSGIDLLELKELRSALNAAIDQLPAQMKMAFTLHREQGMTHEQIAKEMNISKFSSQTYVARAIIQLKKVLGERISLIIFCISNITGML